MISLIGMYLIVGLAVLAASAIVKSHKALYYISLLHATAYLIITSFFISSGNFPQLYNLSYMQNYFMVDHLSIYEIMIASVIFFCAALYARGYIKSLIERNELNRKNIKLFYISFNALLILTIFCFVSNNLGIFWIAAELTTIFSVILIATLNAKENIDAALKYLFVTSSAMLFSLIGLILIYAATLHASGIGTLNWTELMAGAGSLSPQLLGIAFMFTFIGFAAKSGIVPMHTWLPHAHAKAPSVISAILSGVLLNIGMFGIIRIFALVQHTSAAEKLSHFLIFFGILTLAVASLSMLKQTNLKKLIAFSSIENMGILLIGIGLWSYGAIFWSLFFVLAHALIKSMLFLTAGMINLQYDSNNLELMKNVLSLQPFLSVLLIFGSIAIIGIPPFAMFITKLSLLTELAAISKAAIALALLFITIAGFAMIKFVANMLIENRDETTTLKKFRIPLSIKASLMILLLLVLAVSIAGPSVLSGYINSIISELGIGVGAL